MSMLEAGLRGGTVAILLLVAILSLRDSARTPAGRNCALFLLSAVAYVICSAPGVARLDTPLDPLKVSALVGQKKSLYRLSPDGRLTRRAGETEALSDGLVLADRMLSELQKCLKD